jgi:hypothetical protein
MRGQIMFGAVLALVVTAGDAAMVRAEDPPAPASSRTEAARQAVLDQLDDARVNCDVLELEVESQRAQIRSMMVVLRESELTPIQGFSQGPVISGSNAAEREANIKNYRYKLDQVCREFALKSKELFRERRRVEALEAQKVEARVSYAEDAVPLHKEAERLLDLVRKGIETWRGDSPAEPLERAGPKRRPESGPAPDQDLLKDAERLLDLIRRGVEAWQGR